MSTRAKAGASVATVAVLLLSLAASAGAQQRYASPLGSGKECSQGFPCKLTVAFEEAKASDELIVEPGDYELGADFLSTEAPSLEIHGNYSAPAPTIVSGGEEGALFALGDGTSIAYLNVTATAPGGSAVLCDEGGQVDRVVGRAAGGGRDSGIAALGGCDVRDSVAFAAGPDGRAILVNGGLGTDETKVRNATAVAPAGFGLEALSIGGPGEPGDVTVDVGNSILRGGQADVTTGTAISARVLLGHSNFVNAKAGSGGTITDLGGNQTAAPLFVDAANSNFAEAAGSPTIDTGAIDPFIGALAPAGEPRVIGPAPDIGAYETTVTPKQAPPAPGRITSLKVVPAVFKAANLGGSTAIASAKGGKRKAPVAARVTFTASAAVTVDFSVERKTVKRVGKKHKKKVVYKRVKGGFQFAGLPGAASFEFTGRIADKALKPGVYRLIGQAGGASKHASFTIVK